jgi:transcriptional regulator with XRE-family HTH domain
MVGISKGTVAFIEATDYLKGTKRLKHGDIAEKIGLTRSQYDQSRGGRRVVLEPEIKKLQEIYPEVARFFKDIKENLKEPSEKHFSKDEKSKDFIKLYIDMIEDKNQLIELKNEKIARLKKELDAAILAHAETLKSMYTEKELKIEIDKRINELIELKNKNKS